MFKQKVVFVIGAGASKEYDFPVGSELKERIAKAVRFRYQHGFELVGGSNELLDHIRRHAVNNQALINDYTKAANVLAEAIPAYISVDEALHFVSGSPQAIEVGKIAIVQEILEAERNSHLKYDAKTGRPAEANAGWIAVMFSIAISQIRREELKDVFRNVTFVNFNYDRAIEQYLYLALQQRTSASASEAAEIVNSLDMIRPYGSVGRFSTDMHDAFGFGTTAYFDPFTRLSALGTYTDQKPMHDSAALHNAVNGAKLIIFPGFGFHTSNLDLIKRAAGGHQPTHVLATVKGIHHSNYSVIESRIRQNLNTPDIFIEHHDMPAWEFLRQLRPKIQMLSG